jgi:hypothetical protein
MKWWRTSGKGQGFAGLPLQPVNFGLKVEVQSCRQIYVQTYEKKNNNLHHQKFTQTSRGNNEVEGICNVCNSTYVFVIYSRVRYRIN